MLVSGGVSSMTDNIRDIKSFDKTTSCEYDMFFNNPSRKN